MEASTGNEPAKRLSFARKVELTAAVAGILGVLWLFFGSAIQDFFDGDDVRLEPDEIVVANPPADYMTVSGELRQRPEAEPRIEATIRNLGEDTAWIEEARIEVVDSVELTQCVYGGGGDVARTKPYPIILPRYAGVGRRVITRDLHVEIEPGSSARPVLAFQAEDFTNSYMYAIQVQLVAAPSHRLLDLGRFVIGVPGPLDRAGFMLPEVQEILDESDLYPLVSTWCFRHNIAAVKRLLSQPGMRSSRLRALERIYPAGGWRRYADDRTPREAARLLLRHRVIVEAPLFAVFAAEMSGDQLLAKEIRRRAAARLTRRAREGLDSWAGGAVADLERALTLAPTAARRRLLDKARVRRQAEEEARTKILEESF